MSEPLPTVEKDAASRRDVDQWSRHLLHVSQHNRMVIGLGGRLQALANEMREAVGLEPFGWGDAVPDAEFGECSVHVSDCAGQETHRVLSPVVGRTP